MKVEIKLDSEEDIEKVELKFFYKKKKEKIIETSPNKTESEVEVKKQVIKAKKQKVEVKTGVVDFLSLDKKLGS